jgi:hypothetical protein
VFSKANISDQVTAEVPQEETALNWGEKSRVKQMMNRRAILTIQAEDIEGNRELWFFPSWCVSGRRLPQRDPGRARAHGCAVAPCVLPHGIRDKNQPNN